MSRSALYAIAILSFVGGTALLLVAGKLSRDGRENRAQTLQVALDDTWKDVELLKDYKLAERSGRLFDSHELDGKVHVVSFFFTACPTACPRQNAQVQLLHETYAGKGVKFVSITCDPDRDTPGVLAEYAQRYKAGENWYFLTGELLHLRRVAAEMYLMPLDKETHSEKLLVVDKWGKVRGGYHWSKADEMAAIRLQLDRLLAETEPPPPPPPPVPPKPSEDDE